jgi:hypothetical protein
MTDVTALLAGLRQETPPAVPYDMDKANKPAVSSDAAGPAQPEVQPTEPQAQPTEPAAEPTEPQPTEPQPTEPETRPT